MNFDQQLSRIRSGRASRREINRALAAAGLGTFTMGLMARPGRADMQPMYFTWGGNPYEEFFAGYAETWGAMPELSYFGDEDEAYAKMVNGFEPDVVDPCSYEISRWNDAGLIAPIDTARLTNYADVIPSLKQVQDATIDGETMWIATDWGITSVVYRADLAPEYVGNESWSILWDPAYAGRLAQRDAMDDVVMEAALLLGIEDPFDMTDEELDRIRAKLAEQRPLLRYYWQDQTSVIQAVAAGEVVATYAWNDAYAILKKEGVDVGFMVPKEGILTWVDATCIIEGGPGTTEEALAYIDAAISPETGKFLIEEYGYGSSNEKAYDIADPELLVELGIDDPDRVLALGMFYEAFEPETREKAVNMFEEVKAGF